MEELRVTNKSNPLRIIIMIITCITQMIPLKEIITKGEETSRVSTRWDKVLLAQSFTSIRSNFEAFLV